MKKSYGFLITCSILFLSFVFFSLNSSTGYKKISGISLDQNSPPAGDSIAIKIRAIGDHYMSQHGNVGLVIGIYRQRTNPNEPVPPEIYSFGHIRNDTNSPVPDSLTYFKLGSVEKTFCATVLAKMIMDTSLHIKLNDLINKYLPDTLRLPRYINTTIFPHDTTYISLADLATHYSALPDTLWNSVAAPGYTLQRFYEFLESYYDSLRYPPGAGYNYSNPGFGLLGDICSIILDTTYGEAAYRIFSELSMFNTKIQLHGDTLNAAQGHGRNGEYIPHCYRAPSPALEGAGAHFSTIKDMLRFLAFNLGFLQTPLNNTLDTLHIRRKDLPNYPGGGQGLAWQHVRLYENPVIYMINKNGETPDGYSSYITFRPETKTGVVVMSNSTNSPDSVGNVVMKILNPLLPMGVNEISGEVPEGFILYQNYPNPFNPVTKINYELRIANYVSLKVYDVLGNEVFILVNEKQDAGNYEVTFDGSNLSSGLYFYKLEAGNFTETRSMVLIK